ncbi:MAG: response regulator [Flavobacteriales bacterium]
MVEDDEVMRRFIANILETHGKVIMAENGKKALDILEKRAVDIIISDVMMPEMDGHELLGAVKAQPKLKSLPFIILTARADEKEKLAALEIGVDDYITKPFLARELLARVYNLLENRINRLEESSEADSLVPKADVDQQFLLRLTTLITEQLSNSDYSIAELAEDMGMSERNIQRKLKSINGLSPNNYLKEIRLQHARELLETKKHHSVSEVMYASGFKTASHFTKVYFKRFGKKPSEYLF